MSYNEDYFPDNSNTTARTLCSMLDALTALTLFILNYEVYIGLIVFFINLFHFLVLTRKSMRSSSINWIMAATAITDMISQLMVLYRGALQIFVLFYPCYSKKTSYMLYFLQSLITAFDSFAKRCTTWLSLSMAFIRTLVIRNPLKLQYDNLTKPKAKVIIVVVGGIAFLPLGIMNWYGTDIIEDEFTEECMY